MNLAVPSSTGSACELTVIFFCCTMCVSSNVERSPICIVNSAHRVIPHAMRVTLNQGLGSNVQAAGGLEVNLRDAVAREQEFRGEKISEVDRELATQAEERAPPMLRNRPIGPTPMEREEHCRTQEPAMRHEFENGLQVVAIDVGYLWSRSAENARDGVEDNDGDPLDGVRTSPPVFFGRNSRDGWMFLLTSKQEQQRRKHRSPQSQWFQATNCEI